MYVNFKGLAKTGAIYYQIVFIFCEMYMKKFDEFR